MNETNQGHPSHGDPNGGGNHPDRRPYWKRAHRGWPFWVAVFLMLVPFFSFLYDVAMRHYAPDTIDPEVEPTPVGGATPTKAVAAPPGGSLAIE